MAGSRASTRGKVARVVVPLAIYDSGPFLMHSIDVVPYVKQLPTLAVEIS
jgi:glutaredoxin 2